MSWWGWLRSWWKPLTLKEVEVVLYTRQGCHLCDEALGPLESARKRHGFKLLLRDVDSDPTWTEAHGEHVPVVTVNGKVRFRGRVNPVLLERLLTGLTLGTQ